MQVINYKCTLCENVWEGEFVFGVNVEEDGEVRLVDPEEEERHVCRNCVMAIDRQTKGDSQGEVWQEEANEG